MQRLPLGLILATAVGVAWPAHSAAGVPMGGGLYKCRGDTTPPIYQEQPCPPGATLRDFERDPATVSVIPFERGNARAPPAKVARAERPRKAVGKPEKRTAGTDASERRHLREGMSDGEVFARLGPPDLQAGKTGRKTRWTYLPAPGDEQTVTLLRFEDGKVVAVERSIMR